MTENPFQPVGYNPDVRPDAEERAKVPRDRWNRYLSPIPGHEDLKSSPPIGHTRVSTVTKALIQKKALDEWNKRMQLAGTVRDMPQDMLEYLVVNNPNQGWEMLLAAKKAVAAEDKKELQRVADELFNRGGGKERARLGTAMHDFTERRNRGENLDPQKDMPEEHRPSLQAYDQALAEAGILVIPEYLERRVWCEYGVQGTLDNIFWVRNDLLAPEEGAPGELEMRVGDLKTGRDLDKGWPEKLIQLWLYANARFMWDEETEHWVPMPTGLRKDRGVIIHVPMDGTAHVYDVDLSGAGEAVERAMYARRFEAEAPSKARKIVSVDLRGPAFVPSQPVSEEQKAETAAAVTRALDVPPALVTQAGSMVVSTELLDRTAHTDQAIAEQAHAEARAMVEEAVNPSLKAKDGSPLGPLAGPGERGCGVCGRKGHKRNSPKCWGGDDPAKMNEAADALQNVVETEQDQVTTYVDQELDRLNDQSQDPLLASGTTVATSQMPQESPGQMPDATSQMPNGAPHPTCPGHGAGWTNRGDGVWVCEVCGLPSAAVPTTVTQAVQQGQFPPPPQVQPHAVQPPASPERQADFERALDTVAPELSVPPATVQGWPDDWVLADIGRATTSQAVLNIRGLAMTRGAWNPELHEPIGRAKYARLQQEGK